MCIYIYRYNTSTCISVCIHMSAEELVGSLASLKQTLAGKEVRSYPAKRVLQLTKLKALGPMLFTR